MESLIRYVWNVFVYFPLIEMHELYIRLIHEMTRSSKPLNMHPNLLEEKKINIDEKCILG